MRTAASRACGERSRSLTAAPCSAKSCATAKPMPEAAPVTRAFLPASEQKAMEEIEI